MGLTLILAPVAAVLALALGVAVGWRRGLGAGIVTGLGVLAAAGGAFVAVLSLSPM